MSGINYEEVLDRVKIKIDRAIEKNDPTSVLSQAATTNQAGKYEPDVVDLNTGIDWTRSFITGAAALLYYHYKDEKYLDFLKKSFDVYDAFINATEDGHNHDIGFLYSLYAVAYYEVTGDENAKKLALRAADELVKLYRLDAKILCGFAGPSGPAVVPIVDDYMNIAIAMWAYKVTNHGFYKSVIESDLETRRKYFMREDFTFRHSYLFNGDKPIGERNYCGYSVGSVWARGQAWALNGNVNSLVVGGDDNTHFILEGMINRFFEMLGDKEIPHWDMNCLGLKVAPGIDTSAAVAIISALYKLSFISDEKYSGVAGEYVERADKMLDVLINDYIAPDDNDAILTGGQAGTTNVGCVWGDYFFLEALIRKIHGADAPDFWTGK